VFDDEDFLPSMFGINLDIGAYSTDPGEVRKRLEKERQTLSSDTSQAAQAVACRLEFIGEYMLALIDLDRDTATAALAKVFRIGSHRVWAWWRNLSKVQVRHHVLCGASTLP